MTGGTRGDDQLMKVFISWSGAQSLQVADALYNWLPLVLQVVRPYLSVEDTAKGAYWQTEVKQHLDTSDFGILCLTPTNTTAPWISFEAGALSKSVDRGNVTPFLVGLTQGDLTGPLTQFQATEASKPVDVLRLVKDLDKACGPLAVGERVVEDTFEMWWPRLDQKLRSISVPETHQRPVAEMVLEILNSQRALERLIADSSGAPYMEALIRRATSTPDLRAELEDALRDLMQALDACADSSDPAVKLVEVQARALRDLYERMIGRGQPQWKTLRGRMGNLDQRALPPSGA